MAYGGVFTDFEEPMAFAGDYLPQPEKDTKTQEGYWVVAPEDGFGGGGQVFLGAHVDGLAEDTAKMTEQLLEWGVDVYGIVDAGLKAFEEDGYKWVEGNSAMDAVIYVIVEPIYKKHKAEFDAKVAQEKARAEEKARQEAIAVADMKRNVAMALGKEKDLPGKEIVVKKLAQMLNAGWPVYSLLVESGAKKVLPAIAVLYAEFLTKIEERKDAEKELGN